MQIILSPPVAKNQVKANLTALKTLFAPPYENQIIVIQSGKFDVEEDLCIDPVRNWIQHGGRLVLVIGSWKDSDPDLGKSIAKALVDELEQTQSGVIFFGHDPIKFYCVPQMHAKLLARCERDFYTQEYKVSKAIIGSTNLTKGALQGGNYELDLAFDIDDSNDALALASISSALSLQLADFEKGVNVDKEVTSLVQKRLNWWRTSEQHRVAGFRNIGLPDDS
jgi:hypothetical protein